MADVDVWHLYAYKNGDEDGADDEHRDVAEWRLEDVIRWVRTRGYDAILLTRTGERTEFRKPPPVTNVEHTSAITSHAMRSSR